jgi:hypothetical protein
LPWRAEVELLLWAVDALHWIATALDGFSLSQIISPNEILPYEENIMLTLTLSTAVASILAAMSLGGGFYEVGVVDPAWPGNPALIQPRQGGVDRKRFWIPIHVTFEVSLVVAIVLAWQVAEVLRPLLLALASHFVMRLWSFLEFIPKALAFERAEPWSISTPDALRWVRRSRTRLALDLLTTATCLLAMVQAVDA